jgi:monoamine oxidase
LKTDVIVVGAGAAGLAAARALAESSVRVTLIEARDRTGGRVLSQRLGSLGVPVELGAEFIHGDAPETSAYLREADLAKIETVDESWARDENGALAKTNDDFTSVDLFERARSLERDESVDVFLRRFEGDSGLRVEARRARAFVEGFEAADPTRASARAIADELASGTDATSWRPVGSYAPLFAHLEQRCASAGVDLHLDTRVERIAWERGRVTVETQGSDGTRSALVARCAIVTVPVGVLRDENGGISFVPPLPRDKRTALHGIEMGHAVRVALAFRTPFWERVSEGRYRNAAFFRCEGGAFAAFWTQAPLRGRSIVAWAGGPRATSLEQLSENERIALALDAFGGLFSERALARSEFEAGATHDWSRDAFAHGAYSYVVAGAEEARARLGESLDDALFFAGEATATDGQCGTVSGAFGTGSRAAREATRALAGTTAEQTPLRRRCR